MRTKQYTIKKSVSVSGVGLHTGAHATMTFLPAEADHGIKFQRIDLDGQPVVEADVDNVVDCSRGTTIAKGEARVNTVEHTLAALVGLQLDNVLIQIDGPEPPIMDGSSKHFITILKEAGEENQNVPRNFFEITEEIHYQDPENNVEIVGLPTNDYRLTVMVDYNSPVLGSQHATLNNIEFFEKEISNCRTFVFLHELEALFKQGLIKGGDVDNAIVIVDRIVSDDEIAYLAKLFNKKKVQVTKEGFLNNLQLHHKNEPARHKLLDLVGDLALVGMPIKGQILAARPGHYSNVQFAKKIKSIMRKAGRKKAPKYDPNTPPVLDINQISNILPHRYPFQLIDKVIHLNEKYVIGVQNVNSDLENI